MIAPLTIDLLPPSIYKDKRIIDLVDYVNISH